MLGCRRPSRMSGNYSNDRVHLGPGSNHEKSKQTRNPSRLHQPGVAPALRLPWGYRREDPPAPKHGASPPLDPACYSSMAMLSSWSPASSGPGGRWAASCAYSWSGSRSSPSWGFSSGRVSKIGSRGPGPGTSPPPKKKTCFPRAERRDEASRRKRYRTGSPLLGRAWRLAGGLITAHSLPVSIDGAGTFDMRCYGLVSSPWSTERVPSAPPLGNPPTGPNMRYRGRKLSYGRSSERARRGSRPGVTQVSRSGKHAVYPRC